jgi:hypothetical protein
MQRRRLFGLSGALLAVGCVAPSLPLDRAELAKVKRIGVPLPAKPPLPTSTAEDVLPRDNRPNLTLDVLAALNPEGQLPVGLRPAYQYLFQAVRDHHYDLSPEAQAKLMEALRWQGYEAVALRAVPADPFTREHPEDFPRIFGAAKVDAVLDLVISEYGFAAPRHDGRFGPWMIARVNLVSADGRLIMDQSYRVGTAEMRQRRGVTPVEISAAHGYTGRFPRDASPDDIILGIDEALDALVRAVTGALR